MFMLLCFEPGLSSKLVIPCRKIIFVLWFFNAILCLTGFLSDPFDFSSKNGDKQVTLVGHQVILEPY